MGIKIAHQGPSVRASDADEPGFGLGDAVAIAAKPIARALGIQDCLPCQKRQQMLNAASARVGVRIRRLFRRSPEAAGRT